MKLYGYVWDKKNLKTYESSSAKPDPGSENLSPLVTKWSDFEMFSEIVFNDLIYKSANVELIWTNLNF